MYIFIPGYTDSITEKSERKKRKEKGQRNEKKIMKIKWEKNRHSRI